MRVAVLDDAIAGTVILVDGSRITIESEDGFMLVFDASELIAFEGSKNLYAQSRANFNQIKQEKEPEKPRHLRPQTRQPNERPVPEFDLHIEKLVKQFKHLNNHDILTIQLETAQRHIEFAIKNRIPKIVLIHGVGEGVLKAELDFMLGRYAQINFREASYQKYGQGATEVVFRQNAR